MNLDAPDHFEEVMDNWRRWMRSDVPVDGFPQKSAVLSTGGASKSWDDFADEIDSWQAEVTNSCVNDLAPHHSCAIHHHYMSAVFRFERLNVALVLVEARELLRAALLARNVYI